MDFWDIYHSYYEAVKKEILAEPLFQKTLIYV
jgi:hypothetical protein